MKKISYALASILLLLVLVACGKIDKFEFKDESISLFIGEEKQLEIDTNKGIKDEIEYFSEDTNVVSVSNDGKLLGVSEGITIVSAAYMEFYDEITVKVFNRFSDYSLMIESDKNTIGINEEATIKATLINGDDDKELDDVELRVIAGNASVNGNKIKAIGQGEILVEAEAYDIKSNIISIKAIEGRALELRASKYNVMINDSITLKGRMIPEANYKISYEIISNSDIAEIDGDRLIAHNPGIVKVIARADGLLSNEISISIVKESSILPSNINISIDNLTMDKGTSSKISYSIAPANARTDIEFMIVEGINNAEIISNTIYCLHKGAFTIQARINDVLSNKLIINADELNKDPYIGVDKDEFYKSYTPAKSYADSKYRTKHGLMSGSIDEQNESPTLAKNRPMENGKYIRNTDALYSADKNTYYIVDENGRVINQVYKNGGYVTLEEVAAHVFAFGEIPANQSEGKNIKPRDSEWGIYLRCNHTPFSGDTNRYPSEPVLPNISGCGGDIYYFEMDLGTTGTTCDPSYPSEPYNDGRYITRGAARIVYTRYDKNHDAIIDINEKHLFYTYNHYNDFQEYLNYEGGWGEMFGNITGGGVLSSKNPVLCNPTPYVDVIFKSFSSIYS